jgi:ubiquinone/menaquinone biosynthesis C-methylase UbiE
MLDSIRKLYTKRAPHYDFAASLYELIGVRMHWYRQKAVQMLELKAGDTVLELGCGTGLNFPFLEAAIGDEGKIIGIDLTRAMLDQAEARVQEHGWRNVQLVEADARQYEFPTGVDGVLSTFALSIMPGYKEVIEKGARSLNGQGHLVLLDLKLASGFLRFLNPLGVLITKPFAGSYEAGRRRPWEQMRRYLSEVQVSEYHGGFIYIASGCKRIPD